MKSYCKARTAIFRFYYYLRKNFVILEYCGKQETIHRDIRLPDECGRQRSHRFNP